MQDQKQQSPRPFRVGDRVISKRFGEGVVIVVENDGRKYLTVDFKGEHQLFDEEGTWGFSPSSFDIQHAEPEKI